MLNVKNQQSLSDVINVFETLYFEKWGQIVEIQLKSDQKTFFLRNRFLTKNLLPVDYCPQNSTNKVTLIHIVFQLCSWMDQLFWFFQCKHYYS